MRLCARLLLAALVFCAVAAAYPAWAEPAPEAPTAIPSASPEPVFPEQLSADGSVTPDVLVAPDLVHISVTLTNNGASGVDNLRLLRPNGSLVKAFGRLESGASVALEEDLDLTLGQFRDGAVTYLVRCTLNPGGADEVEGWMTLNVPFQTIPAQPSVEFSRSVSSEYVQAGEQVALTYRVVNTGNVPLINLVVSDPLTGDIGKLDELAPGRKHTFTTRTSVYASVESLPTLTYASKSDPDVLITNDLGGTDIIVTDQRLEATLTADSAAVRSGQSVTLRLTLLNASEFACEDLRVYDHNGLELDTPPISLKPGEQYELTESVVMHETTAFYLTIAGVTEGGSAISTRSNALTIAVQVSEQKASIAVSAQINPNTPVSPGMVMVTIRLINTGEATLRGVRLSEQTRGAIRTVWVLPPGETLIDQAYPIGGKPFVFLAEAYDDNGGRLTVLSSPITVESAAQPVISQPTPTPLPLISGVSYRMADGQSTFIAMMLGITATLTVLIAIILINAMRRRKKLEKQRRIHIKRIRRSMREQPKPTVSQETRLVPVVRRGQETEPPAEER